MKHAGLLSCFVIMITNVIAQEEFKFKPRYINVLGSEMHYVEEGKGDPILLIHGNPASSYIWRNMIGQLSKHGRVIAVDLIGMGKSGKPNIEYSFLDHFRYLETFIEKMNLTNITLVMHDWGSALGFTYAMRNESRVKRMAFFEALITPLPPLDQWPQKSKDAFTLYRTPDKGWDAIVNQNDFVEVRMQEGTIRKLTEAELKEYRKPFKNLDSRKPLWKWPNEIPIEGKPAEVHIVQMDFIEFLKRSEIPKLLIFAEPGVLTPTPIVHWCKENLPNLETQLIGKGLHNLQEDDPEKLNTILIGWITGGNK